MSALSVGWGAKLVGERAREKLAQVKGKFWNSRPRTPEFVRFGISLPVWSVYCLHPHVLFVPSRIIRVVSLHRRFLGYAWIYSFGLRIYCAAGQLSVRVKYYNNNKCIVPNGPTVIDCFSRAKDSRHLFVRSIQWYVVLTAKRTFLRVSGLNEPYHWLALVINIIHLAVCYASVTILFKNYPES